MAIRLTEFRVGLPALRFAVEIAHSVPRILTAFERITLLMCDRLSADPLFRRLPVVRAFEDFLCVPDAAPIVGPVINELITLGAAVTKRKDADPQWLRLEELEITGAGQQMLAENEIAAQTQVHEESFLFDPITGKILPEEDLIRYSPQPPSIRVDAEAFRNLFPENLIRKAIPEARFSWWRPQARVQGLRQLAEPEILWREVMAGVHLDDGRIMLQLPNETETEYVNRLSSQEIVERFLRPVFGLDRFGGEQSETWPTVLPSSVDSDTRHWIVLPRFAETIPESARWCIVHPSLQSLAFSVQAPGRLIIGFDPRLSRDLTVQWNSAGDSCQVTRRTSWPLPPDVLCVCEREMLIGRRIQVRVQDEEVLLPAGVWTPQPTSESDQFDVLRDLASKLRETVNEDHLLIPRWWQSKDPFETETRETLVAAGYSVSKAEAFIARLQTRYTTIQERRGICGTRDGNP
jgi:hypothetical protein